MAGISIRQLYGHDSLIIPDFLNKVTWTIMKISPIWLHLYMGAIITKKELELERESFAKAS
jgi:hypothetical protein